MADYTLFKLRGNTRANWLADNPILNNRELAMETDTMRFKVGDGLATYSQLPYGRNTGEYINFYNVTAFLPLPAGYYYTHDTAISNVVANERCKGLIVSYEVSSGVWYTERFIGTDVANWGVLANWEQMPDSSDFTALHDVITAYNNHAANTSNPHSVTKEQVGLSEVDNTSDLNKPISIAQQTAINAASTTFNNHVNDTDNPHDVTKIQLGLSNVDNTSDSNKPISTATQNALDNKVNVSGDQIIYGVKSFYASPTVPNPTENNDAVNKATLDLHKNDSTNPHQVTKAQVGLGNVDNTSDADKPISSATQTALNLKENTSNKGAVNGYASLDETGKVPTGQLPSYVDDVLEYANLASFPVSGEQGKIYVALDTNKTYRWSGSAYIYITSGAVDSVAGKTGVVSLVKGDVGLGNVDNTSDANKPVSTAQQTALNSKVSKTGAETITDLKTFTTIPQIPTTDPALDAQVASKKYVDAKDAQIGADLKQKYIKKSLGKNRFNPNDENILVDSYINNLGSIVSGNASYCLTGFIPIYNGETLFCNTAQEGLSTYNAQYDSNYNIIPNSWVNSKKATYVSNATYVRFTYVKASVAITQIEIGLAATEYLAYTQLKGLVTSESIADNSIKNSMLIDRSVSKEKADFFENINLFNPADVNVALGYYVMYSNGVLSASSIYNATGYIPVIAGKSYTLSYKHQIAWYDINKVYISGSSYGDKTQVAPTNSAYLRCSVHVYFWDLFMVAEGTSLPNSYIPYSFNLKNDLMPYDYTAIVDNDICIPSKMYMLSGTQNDIFIEPFIKRWKPYDWVVRFTGTSNYSRRLQRVASISSPINGSTVISSLIELNRFVTKQSKTSTIVVGTKSVGTIQIPVSIVGDSYTNGAFFKDALLDKGYVPNIKLIGLRKVSGYTGQYDEGRGGWTLDNYFTVKTSSTEFNPFMHPNTGRYWGSTGFWINAWKVFRGTAGGYFEPTYSCSRYDDYLSMFNETTGYAITPSIGDVVYDTTAATYKEWDGSVWNNTTKETYTWSFNYSKYLAMFNLAAPLILCEMLGLNDFRDIELNVLSFTTWNARIEAMKASYISAVPTGKFVIMIPCSTTGLLNNEAGDFTTKQHAAMWECRKNIINTFDNREADGIYLVDTAISIDNEYGYGLSSTTVYTKPYSEYVGTESIKVQSGNPHPYPNYPTMGISLAAFIQKYRS